HLLDFAIYDRTDFGQQSITVYALHRLRRLSTLWSSIRIAQAPEVGQHAGDGPRRHRATYQAVAWHDGRCRRVTKGTRSAGWPATMDLGCAAPPPRRSGAAPRRGTAQRANTPPHLVPNAEQAGCDRRGRRKSAHPPGTTVARRDREHRH